MTPTQTRSRARRATAIRVVVLLAAPFAASSVADAQEAPPPPFPAALSSVTAHEPPDLERYVRDRAAAIQLGKALFWDLQVGSDERTACATCHFRAGADPRAAGVVHPGTLLLDGSGRTVVDDRFDLPLGRPLVAADLPLRVLEDPSDRASRALRDTNDVVGSAGVHWTLFLGLDRFGGERTLARQDPDGFRLAGANLRRVTARHAPSVINAVFQQRQFWDGRAQPEFNGVNGLGARDPAARLRRREPDGRVREVAVRIAHASLASQAVSPPVSSVEMSAHGRRFDDLARRLLGDGARRGARPLAHQRVRPDDSVLGSASRWLRPGLAVDSYEPLVRAAFQPEWWSDPPRRSGGERLVVSNFPLFFGLAIQLYEATLVSDDTPFDRWLAGDASALGADAVRGAELFRSQTRGRCINCHTGPELTDASTAAVEKSPIRIREGQALDRGFNNIGVRPTSEDLGVGGVDALGIPLSQARLARPAPAEPLAVDGAFKAPGLRNVALTAPYFHNGGTRTLEEVIELYSRGGDLAPLRARDGTEIRPLSVLALTAQEKADFLAFLEALTDERVRLRREPFDHPELWVPEGVSVARTPRERLPVVAERWRYVPAAGRRGAEPLPGFLEPSPAP